MAIDGAMLHLIKKELEQTVVGGRVEKITQPGSDEIVITFRTLSGPYKVIFSASPSDARVHITRQAPENPKVPPMLCMLLRKILGGARLVSIEQPGLERVLLFSFEGYSEIGDPVTPVLAMEIMGRYSNLILVDTDGKVIDAVRRVDASLSGKRLVLPGILYQLPPPQDKMNILAEDPADIARKAVSGNNLLHKELIHTMQGICPLMAREIAFEVDPRERTVDTFTAEDTAALTDRLTRLRSQINDLPPVYTMAVGTDGRPIDFTYQDIHQYGDAAKTVCFNTAGDLLDRFFAQRDSVQRVKNRSGELYKLLQNTITRIKRKISAQEQDLLVTEDRDKLREKGDILSAYPYLLQKGMTSVELDNFYSGEKETIDLDPALTPVQNAQRYYTLYKKSCAARAHLTKLLEDNKKELEYVESVFQFLHNAETEEMLAELRAELEETGYVRSKGRKQKRPKRAKPLEFRSTDGNRILVGRNNRQNEELSLRTARGNDMWFHAKNHPGSHVIAFDDGMGISDRTIEEAAMLAAYYSRASGSNQIPVDYIWAKEIKKPQGGRPGMVIYHTNYTLYTTPDEEMIEKMRVEKTEKNS